MSEKFIIQGGKRLQGEIEVCGSKNATGAILSACLLTNEEVILNNLPLVSDILNTIEILQGMGVEIEWLDKRKIRIKAGDDINPEKMDFEKVAKSRVSVLLIGSLATRFKEFKIAKPGGDKIGLRPITTHLDALKKMGIQGSNEGNFYCFKRQELKSAEIVLSEFSVTATENLIMAGSLAQGKTIIKGAAAEPEPQNLIELLIKMGAKIKGKGTHSLEIDGVEKLGGAEHTIIPDRVEAGTFICLAALMGDGITIKNIRLDHLDLFLAKLKEIGVDFEIKEHAIKVLASDNFKATRVQAFPYPGFPTDLLPLVAPILTQAEGKSLIHDPLYENRFNYTMELRKMGADIEIVDPHRAFVFGKTGLKGLKIESWDIRAGAALVVAGLMAEGQTIIENISQIDRGYEKIEERLQALGGDIKRTDA